MRLPVLIDAVDVPTERPRYAGVCHFGWVGRSYRFDSDLIPFSLLVVQHLARHPERIAIHGSDVVEAVATAVIHAGLENPVATLIRQRPDMESQGMSYRRPVTGTPRQA